MNIGSSCNWGIGNAATILLVQNKEDQLKSQDYIFNSFLLTFFISIIPLGFLLFDRIFGIALFDKYHLDNKIYAVVFLIVSSYLSGLLMNISRVKNRIWEITIAQLIWPTAMFSILFFATDKQLLFLLLVAYAVSSIVAIGIYLLNRQISFNGHFSVSLLKEIFVKGFFLFLYNAGFTFIVLSTKAVVSKYYPVEEFGYFSFAFSLANGILLLLDSLIFIVFHKMIDLLRGNDKEKIAQNLKMLRHNYLYMLHFLFYTVLAASGFFVTFFPQYSKSYNSFILIISSLVMYSNCFGYNTYLLAQNKEKVMALFVGLALLCNITIALLAVNILHCKFSHVILATFFTYGLYSLAVNCYAMRVAGLKRNFKALIHSNTILKLLPLYLGATLLVLAQIDKKYFVLPLVVFVLLNIIELKNIFKNIPVFLKEKKINI